MTIILRSLWIYHLLIKEWRKGFLFFSLYSSLLASVTAQTSSLVGVVTDESGNPLPGVLIQLTAEPSKGTISDVNGSYKIDAAPTDILKFSFVFVNAVRKGSPLPLFGLVPILIVCLAIC